MLVAAIAAIATEAWRLYAARPPGRIALAAYRGPVYEAGDRVLTSPAGDRELSLFLAGDTLITKPWSDVREPDFARLVAEIRAADAAVANLETLIHEYRGYAQADSGGTWMASPPKIADELAWAGFDLLGHANNHTFDYGSEGVLETHENAKRAGLVLAGSGPDLQAARAPRYFRTPRGTVALVSMTATFSHYGRASRSRPDLHGRPGANPLALVEHTELEIAPGTAANLKQWAQTLGFGGSRFVRTRFELAGLPFQVRERNELEWGKRLDPADREGNIAAIREAASSDVTIVSIHAHGQGDWLREFAHDAIDAGADVFLAHGPHEVRGVELYAGKPIFYCLGDFVFQTELIERLPVEHYDLLGLGDDATPAASHSLQNGEDASLGYPSRRAVWEGAAAALRFEGDRLVELRLLPVDLRFGEPMPPRGWPSAASDAVARRVLETIAGHSEPYGTAVLYVDAKRFGLVPLAP